MGIENDVGAARKSEVAASRRQVPAGGIQSDQRRGAGRIDGNARAGQVEGIGDPVGGNGEDGARSGSRFAPVAARALHPPVIGIGNTDEDTRIACFERRERQPGILRRLERDHEQQALLGVEAARLRAGEAEKRRVECSNIIQKSAPFGNGARGFVRLRIVETFEIPARGGDLADRRAPLGKEAPEVPWGLYAARKTAPHSDDGDPVHGGGSQFALCGVLDNEAIDAVVFGLLHEFVACLPAEGFEIGDCTRICCQYFQRAAGGDIRHGLLGLENRDRAIETLGVQ